MLKKTYSLLSLLTVIALIISILASCKSEPTEEGNGQSAENIEKLEAAICYLENEYGDEATETPENFNVPASLEIDSAKYTVTWNTSDERITVSEDATSGYYTVVIPETVHESIDYTLTATVSDSYGNKMQVSFERTVPFVYENENAPILPSPDSHISIKEANELGLNVSEYTDGKYYVTGIVDEITDTTYGNIYITDEEGNKFYICGTYSNDGGIRFDSMDPQPEINDTVTVYGIIGNDLGTAQMKDGRITEITKGPEYKVVHTFETDVPYKLGMIQENASKTDVYYYDGGVIGYFLTTNTNPRRAADVYLEEARDGYYIYTFVEGEKKYINIAADGNYIDPAFEDNASTVYRIDEELLTPVATVNGILYRFGAVKDSAHTNIGLFEYSINNFYCQFYSTDVEDIPDVPVIILPDGSENNPFIIDALPYYISYTNIHDFYYKYTADRDRTITITYPQNTFISGLPAGTIHDSDKKTYTFDLKEGESVKFNLWSPYEFGVYKYTVTSDEEVNEVISGDGSVEDPYVISEEGNYVCHFDTGWSATWYSFTVAEDGFITVSSTFEKAWIQIGADVTSASNNSNHGSGEKITFIAAQGQTVMIGIGDWESNTVDIPFLVEFEAAEFGDASFLEGNWTGSEETEWGDVVSYMIVVYADGTGIGVFDAGYGKTYFDITSIIYANGNIIFRTVTTGEYGGTETDIFFEYSDDGEEPTLTTKKALYWYPLVLTPYYGLLDDGLVSGDNSSIQLESGYNQINAQNTSFIYVAEKTGSITLTASAAISGDVLLEYTVNGKNARTLDLESTVNITLLKGDVLKILAIADGYATILVSWNSDAVKNTVCDFSTLDKGTQYANEVVTFDDCVTVSTKNFGCYINTYLRIYDGTDSDGYAIIEVDGAVTRLEINAGYKVSELAIYGSNDAESWTLIELVSTSEEYKDYTVLTDLANEYKFLMLDAVGAQVRIASIDIYYDLQNE